MEVALGVLMWSPSEFWASTYREFICATVGYKKANSVDKTSSEGLTEADQELLEFTKQFPKKVKSIRKPEKPKKFKGRERDGG